MKHTNEPWDIMPGRSLLHVESSSAAPKAGEPVCSIPLKREADADRIVACVNALAGVSDPAALVASWHEMLATLDDVVRAGLGSKSYAGLIARARAAGPVKP